MIIKSTFQQFSESPGLGTAFSDNMDKSNVEHPRKASLGTLEMHFSN